MKYDLFFCQDAPLGIQQISKHTFVNSMNEMMYLWHTRFSFIAVPSTAALSHSNPSSDRMSCASCGAQDNYKWNTLYILLV